MQRTARIVNDLGLHLRAAGALVQLAGRYRSEIWLQRGELKVNAKSVLSVLSLGAAKGVDIAVVAEGADEQQAVEAIVRLIQNGFGT